MVSNRRPAGSHASPGRLPGLLGKLSKIFPVELAAETIMGQSSADGPARATWYDLIVEGAIAAAQSLAMPLMIGGDRDRNPHDTPFVRLIMGLESLLPSGMQSPSMAASAKRIERSPRLVFDAVVAKI